MKFLKSINNDILVITIVPELLYHLYINKQMSDDCLSKYCKWVIGKITEEE